MGEQGLAAKRDSEEHLDDSRLRKEAAGLEQPGSGMGDQVDTGSLLEGSAPGAHEPTLVS